MRWRARHAPALVHLVAQDALKLVTAAGGSSATLPPFVGRPRARLPFVVFPARRPLAGRRAAVQVSADASPRDAMQRGRIARIVGTKVAIALTLSLSANLGRTAVEYRTLGPLDGLEAGAPVTLAGQVIGTVLAIERRGDTTALRVRYVRGAERLPGSLTVRVRPMGLDDSVVLEFSPVARPARSLSTRCFARGGWLTVGPRPVIEPPPGSRVAEPAPPPPPLYRLLPLPTSPPRITRLPWRA